MQGLDSQPHEIILGVDPGATGRVPASLGAVRVAAAVQPSIPAAVNAAIGAARGDQILMMEDDDIPHRARLRIQQHALSGGPDMVTSNSLEVSVDGKPYRVMDFPNPSGWLFHRRLIDQVGEMDVAHPWHWDLEFLGRVGLGSSRRLHILERNALAAVAHNCAVGSQPDLGRRLLLRRIQRCSALAESSLPRPLVYRMVNPEGALACIQREPMKKEASLEEYRRIEQRWGFIPA